MIDLNKIELCFYVPAHDGYVPSVIDVARVNDQGETVTYFHGETLAALRERYPTAELISIEEFDRIKEAALRTEPTMADIESMQAADLEDAKQAARRFQRDLRACKLAMGPSADLVQIERTGDYVCREMPIEPTPESILHRYSELAGRKI